MAGEDNILNLFIRANVEGLKPAIDAAVATVKGGIDSMKVAAASLPDTVQASVDAASIAFVSLNPQLQAQGAELIDLKIAYQGAKDAIRETEGVIIEAGGTVNAETSILRRYAEENVNLIVLNKALTDATREYDRAVKDLLNDQILAAEAARKKALATEAETRTGVLAAITEEDHARAAAKMAELDALAAARSEQKAVAKTAEGKATVAANESIAASTNVVSEAQARVARATIADAAAHAEVRAIVKSATEYIGME